MAFEALEERLRTAEGLQRDTTDGHSTLQERLDDAERFLEGVVGMQALSDQTLAKHTEECDALRKHAAHVDKCFEDHNDRCEKLQTEHTEFRTAQAFEQG